ncbi:MAG: hypothetical protein AAF288_02155 [Planctomycetota bacterium]
MDIFDIVSQTARLACEQAADDAPHAARSGQAHAPLMSVVPWARLLIADADALDPTQAGSTADTSIEVPPTWRDLGPDRLADPATRWTDGRGQSRPVYRLLVGWLLGRVCERAPELASVLRPWSDAFAQAESRADYAPAEAHHALWSRLLWPEQQLGAAFSCDSASLFELGPDDQLEPWTFRELVGLHALSRLALHTGEPALHARARQVAEYHHAHTQPDYTTYQPWAVAEFLSDPFTAMFGEQQLHDVRTHLAIGGPGASVVAALLLCEACDALRTAADHAGASR